MIKRHQKKETRKTNGHREASANGNGKLRVTEADNFSAPPDEKQTCSSKINNWFRKFAHKTSEIVGSPWSFIIATLSLIIWAILGPAAGFSDTWQLVINTATTIVTFLMVFLIQNTQNRDAKAIHLKLDELIHSIQGARNKLINLEDLSEEELAKLQEHFKRLGKTRETRSANQPASREKDLRDSDSPT